MHRTLCQGVEHADGLRSGKPDFVQEDQRTGVLDGTGDDALGPDNVTASDGIGPDKVGPFKSLIKVNPHQLTLQPGGKLSDELGLARASFTRQPSVMRERIIKGNQGLMQMGRVENVVIDQGRGFRIRPEPDLKITKIDPVIGGDWEQIPGPLKPEAGQTGGNLRQNLGTSADCLNGAKTRSTSALIVSEIRLESADLTPASLA
jgi:hypothetical protein